MKIPFTVVQAEALNAYVCFQTRKHSLQAQPFVWCMFLFEVFYTLLDVHSINVKPSFPVTIFSLGRQIITLK